MTCRLSVCDRLGPVCSRLPDLHVDVEPDQASANNDASVGLYRLIDIGCRLACHICAPLPSRTGRGCDFATGSFASTARGCLNDGHLACDPSCAPPSLRGAPLLHDRGQLCELPSPAFAAPFLAAPAPAVPRSFPPLALVERVQNHCKDRKELVLLLSWPCSPLTALVRGHQPRLPSTSSALDVWPQQRPQPCPCCTN